MMFVNTQHKGVKTAALQFLAKNDHQFLVSSDYNNIIEKIERKPDVNRMYLSFKCYNFKQIYGLSGDYFINKYYSGRKDILDKQLDCTVDSPEAGFDFTLSFDCSIITTFGTIKEVPKQATPEQLEQYKQDKEQNRMKNQVIIDRIAAQISEFKTHFYAACFEQTFDRILAGDVPAPFKVETRENEFICVVPDSTNIRNQQYIFIENVVNIFIGVSFEDKVDRIIAKLIVTEMVEAKRHVKNAPGVQFISENDSCPQILKENFPDMDKQKAKMQNGIINISIIDYVMQQALQKSQHFSSNYDNISTLLQGFRQYLHYHIHASKTYLHTRIIKRINQLNVSLKNAQFEKEDEVYRTDKTDNRLVKAEEEEKKSNVWKK